MTLLHGLIVNLRLLRVRNRGPVWREERMDHETTRKGERLSRDVPEVGRV